jgi:hypothetical protein
MNIMMLIIKQLLFCLINITHFYYGKISGDTRIICLTNVGAIRELPLLSVLGFLDY